ncbi:hypothetical protein [Streptomyces sp. NBC_00096]|uniref:hypothetical protein n=1 Tax=Streptomyces sp. NBC_00096 TaxID=2975650 RepID=UPI00324B91CD
MSASPHRRPTGRRRLVLVAVAVLVAAGLGAVPLVVQADAVAPADLAHGVLPARDGWAASGTGTTGGSAVHRSVQAAVDAATAGDTVLNWAPSATGQYRQYFRHRFVAGDFVFVFGNATAVYDHVNITLRDRGAAAGGPGGYLAAPHTGPGAGTGANRPQLGPDRAAAHTARAYLAGTDGWNPTG